MGYFIFLKNLYVFFPLSLMLAGREWEKQSSWWAGFAVSVPGRCLHQNTKDQQDEELNGFPGLLISGRNRMGPSCCFHKLFMGNQTRNLWMSFQRTAILFDCWIYIYIYVSENSYLYQWVLFWMSDNWNIAKVYKFRILWSLWGKTNVLERKGVSSWMWQLYGACL